MYERRSVHFFQALPRLLRALWDGEADESGPGRGLEGDPREFNSLREDAGAVSVALCSHDEPLLRETVSALRRQPILPPGARTVRREGLFTLIALPPASENDAERAFRASAGTNGFGPEESFTQTVDFAVWADDAPAHQAASDMAEDVMIAIPYDAVCVLYLVREAQGWQDYDAHTVARLRQARVPLKILVCCRSGAQEERAATDLIYSQTGIRPLFAAVEPLDPNAAVEAVAAPGLDEVVDWMAAQNRDLALALAQELPRFRPLLARRHMQNAAWVAAVVGAEPAPLIDIPLLLLIQQRMARQIAAMYEQPAPPLVSRTGAGIVTLGLCTRYLAQQLIKLIPFIGWLLSAGVSGVSTWLLGLALMRHYAGREVLPRLGLKARGRRILASFLTSLANLPSSAHRRFTPRHSVRQTRRDIPVYGGDECFPRSDDLIDS
ncbi:MAG: hypothetical protein H6642_15190 [Caldilineaceae bacterium]|nr:hypothetical protein [Caldilineaceae bacterium]